MTRFVLEKEEGGGRNGILRVMTILEERKAMSRYENQSRKKKERKKRINQKFMISQFVAKTLRPVSPFPEHCQVNLGSRRQSKSK